MTATTATTLANRRSIVHDLLTVAHRAVRALPREPEAILPANRMKPRTPTQIVTVTSKYPPPNWTNPANDPAWVTWSTIRPVK